VPASTDFQPGDVVAFWRDAGLSRWFKKDDAFDLAFRNRFLAAHEAAARGELDAWSRSAEGALALCILLDQFPRNAFRGSARMFATDAKAREIARGAIDAGFDSQVDGSLRQFFYMPLEHSESLQDQDRALELLTPLGDESRRWAALHRDIIVRFGRFPHRNPVLGRTTTPEEQRFLDEGGFSG
jgi:uncharacterized protein (DUF924 family)